MDPVETALAIMAAAVFFGGIALAVLVWLDGDKKVGISREK